MSSSAAVPAQEMLSVMLLSPGVASIQRSWPHRSPSARSHRSKSAYHVPDVAMIVRSTPTKSE